jgi:hypothetical protein
MQSIPPFHVGGTIYFEFQTKKPSDGVTPVAPNSTPTVTVYKNGSATGESSTIAPLSGVTGGYSVSLNPAGDAEADNYILKVEAAITDSDFNGGSPFTHPEWFHTRCIGPVASIQAKTDNLPSDPADQSAVEAAITAAVSAIRGADGDTLETLSDQIDGLGTTGTGARTVTITVNDGTIVLQNARVRLTEGANTYTGSTNASGVIVFNVDDATYTVGITKSGYTYAGTTLIVDGTETRTYSMTVVSVTPPDDPALCAVIMHVYDQYGADMASQPVEITFVRWESTATDTPPVLSPPPVLSTNSEGIVSTELFREATYKIVYGNAPYTRRVDVTIPDAATYTVEL